MNFKKESDIADYISDYYLKMGYEVFNEVHNDNKRFKNNRADLYLKLNNETIVIETKKTFGLKIIEQCYNWKPHANKVFMCVPSAKKRNTRRFGYKMCVDYGIGVIEINKRGEVKIVLDSNINHNPITPKLYEEQKTQIGGTKPSKDSYITPFKLTVNRIREYIKDGSKYKLNEVIKNIEHHYKNDKSGILSITKMIKYGVIGDIKIFKEGKSNYIQII